MHTVWRPIQVLRLKLSRNITKSGHVQRLSLKPRKIHHLTLSSVHPLRGLKNHINRSLHMRDHRTMPTVHLDHVNSRLCYRSKVVDHLLLVLRQHDAVGRALEIGDGNVVVARTGHAFLERGHRLARHLAHPRFAFHLWQAGEDGLCAVAGVDGEVFALQKQKEIRQ